MTPNEAIERCEEMAAQIISGPNVFREIASLLRQGQIDAVRLHWLHDCSTGQMDPDGYEWGIYRVKWENGRAVDVLQTDADFRDLDAEMRRELSTPNEKAEG